jgi:three-Cys-motif partner protein
LAHPGLSISAVNSTFEQEANALADWLLRMGAKAPPTFSTADPYGFKGVPLNVIRRLMSVPRSEVLITFIVRDMRRFLDQENFEAPLDEFFGGATWRDCSQLDDATSREECLLLRYSELVRHGTARFATPFRVFEDERRQTLYYLVHLTNHPLGMRKMRKRCSRSRPT